MIRYLAPASLLQPTALLCALCAPLACADGSASEADTDDSVSPQPDVQPSDTDGDTSQTAVSPSGNGGPGKPCDAAERVGSFKFYLGENRTIFLGAVSDKVSPTAVPELVASESTCSLVAPQNPFCNPSCPSGQTCAGQNECVDSPRKVSAGTAKIVGALAEVEAEASAITDDYSSTLFDPFPAFVPGAAISLTFDGADTEPFTLQGWGVTPMLTDTDVVSVATGSGAMLQWDAAGADVERSEVYINFSVNVHGAVTGWIECTAEDDGSFEIPEPLVTQLINMGLSGFPRATLGRRSVDRTTIASGCVDFEVSSEVTIDLEVDGLISCDRDDDCPDGQSCSGTHACE